ncbi:hypothetical protein HLB23_25260 [Nocardia uniformis]|uniref:Uncharacterized protein n=1 Tax=Nocardia uniformis TaxID=53432 RepID=A0A849C9T9_9NOCA|nr:hypothetical protein [Nocardia uniformis]NNH73130.1 hypothetical protein [Nocardia uniformis]
MRSDDYDQIELQVIQDVLDTVEAQLRERERRGWRLTAPRSRIYAAVLYAVIVSARAAHTFPATLDRADILDEIFDGIDPFDSAAVRQPVEDAINNHTVQLL